MRKSIFFLVIQAVWSAETYRRPPQQILDVLNTPPAPQASLSPAGDTLLLIQPVRYPSIADLAAPMLRLAGQRINPATNGPHRASHFAALTLKRIADGSEVKVALPAGAKLGMPEWGPDGRRFAFTITTATGIEIWVAEAATGQARRLPGVVLNASYGDALQWMPDSRTLLVQLIPAGRGKPPQESGAPAGPNVQETTGKSAPVRTFQDLLSTPHDEDLFDYYATAQLALVDSAGGKLSPLGPPGIFQMARPSPDGHHLLVARVHRPYSYLHSSFAFPKDVEVWNLAGKSVHRLASLPLADRVPMEGVPTGPRGYHWHPTEPGTLVWVEALDGGNPREKVPDRDRILMSKAPFDAPPVELMRTEQRFSSIRWLENGGALVRDNDRRRRWSRTFLVTTPGQPPRLVWNRSSQDRYQDPGEPVERVLPTGHRVVRQSGDWIFLAGTGASPAGDRPFLDRFHLRGGQAERQFRSEANNYESFVGLVDPAATRVLTRRESPNEPPNYYLRALPGGEARALTAFPDPAPQLRQIRKQRVTYKRADGVQLSFTLYLPPGYQEGTRLPALLWAYPREYNDPDTAGQIVGSTQRFTSITGASHLFCLLAGYAILDGATMPVVGSDPETVNSTYIEQIVMSARAAIDKAAEMGVVDPKRVAVGGHSYGAFMTANLLAHSDLFRAGIARSGAYNRTLTPFGFQSERRTLWEASELYLRMSPFLHANKIRAPLLFIHGEADNNAGTFPIQSERMYQAVRGHGGTARLVLLPHESHGYAARESIEHTLYETIAWLDRWVKDSRQ